MPNRIVRDSILTSERIATLGWAEEVFYRRLMSIVDDYGRTEAGHQLLRAKCYPLQTDSVRVADISRWMAACHKSGLILEYAANGKQYLEIANFGQQLRSASKCPDPKASDIKCSQVTSDEHLGVSVSVSVSDMARQAPPVLPDPPFIEIPLNDGTAFPITASQVDEFSGLYPSVEVAQELRGMRAWAIANPSKRKTKGGVMRFVNSWLAKEQDKGGKSNGGRVSEPSLPRLQA